MVKVPGWALEDTRSRNRVGPAGTCQLRGGRKVMVAVPSLAGNMGSAAGSITDHPAGGPSRARTNLSTTDPRLRTRTSMVASAPGSTSTSVGASTATTATRPAVDAGPVRPGWTMVASSDCRSSSPSQSRNAPHGPGRFGEVGLAQNVVPGVFWKPHSGQTSIAGTLRPAPIEPVTRSRQRNR